jgi:Flp pilus assembly protein TadD
MYVIWTLRMSEQELKAASEGDSRGGLENYRIIRFLRGAAIPVLLVGLTVALYWPVRHFGFINYDDPHYVSSNRRVREGLSWPGLVWAFRTGETANWHPLTWLSHMTDVSLFGINPGAHHLMSVLIHGLNAALVFILLQNLTGARWRSFFVAALFALHPLHVESVAWIAERKDVLSTFFGLLSLLCYGRYVEGKNRTTESSQVEADERTDHEMPVSVWTRDYGLALVFFALSLMSKPMLVTIPFVLLLLDHLPLGRMQKAEGGRQKWALIVEKWPFFLFSAAFCLITFFAQKTGGAVVDVAKIPISMRIENVFVSYVRYLGKLLWPTGLAVPYPYPSEWPWFTVIFCVVLVVGFSVIAWRLDRYWPFVGTGWFWFLGTLVPAIGFVQVGNQSMADRYTYVPSIGIFILLAWGVGTGFDALRPRREDPLSCDPANSPGLSQAVPVQSFQATDCARARGVAIAVCGIAAITVLAACALTTRKQLSYWRNSEALFRHAILVTKNNGLAFDNLGLSLLSRGHLDEAAACYIAALQVHKKDSIALDGLGCCLFNKGRTAEAIQYFRQAIEIKPNQALTLFNLGSALAQQEDYDKAISCFRAAMRLAPENPDIPLSLGMAYARQGRFEEAADCYRVALRVDREDIPARKSLAVALVKLGRPAEARTNLMEVLRLKPDDRDAAQLLGSLPK